MRTVASGLTWATLLAGSVALTVLVSMHESPAAEAEAIRAVQSWPVPGSRLSNAVRAVTAMPFVLAFGAALVAVRWLQGVRREAITLAVLFVALAPAQAALKWLVDRPRPDEDLLRASVSSPSFPAAHVMGPVVVYGALLYFGLVCKPWGRRWRLVAVSWAVVVLATTGVVNVYLGVHWPTDVLGGYIWGLVLLLPAVNVLSRWR